MKRYPYIETVNVFNMYDAVKSIRKAFKNEDACDSKFVKDTQIYSGIPAIFCYSHAELSNKDLTLAQKLIKAGCSHRKFMRQILVSFDIEAPMYWWKEFDTYKVGVVRNSESTMHTILKNEIKQSDFVRHIPEDMLNYLNDAIKAWNKANTTLEKDDMFMYIINNLPSGYIQKSHITCSYENLYHMWHERHDHKLPEWKYFCNSFISKLPYFNLFLM